VLGTGESIVWLLRELIGVDSWALTKRQGKQWVLNEYKLHHNQPPSPKSIDVVNDWLAKEQSRAQTNKKEFSA
jgi:hypothetical protein